MPTASRIQEESFRLGAGRYIQQCGAVSLVGEECVRLGAKVPLVVGGATALAIAKEKIDASLSASGISAVYYTYHGFCSDEGVSAVTTSCGMDFDAVIGVGGGTVMDVAKALAIKLCAPVINIPTSSATCAAFTPLSVFYKVDGRKDRTVHHKTEVNAVLADMDILSNQPPRLFLSGAYDAMAKLYELRQRMLGVDTDECDIGLLASYHTSSFMVDLLGQRLDGCVEDLKRGIPTKRLYDCIYTSIALCGVVSGLARGSNQTAIAHKIYEIARNDFSSEALGYLHGELVAMGLVLQIAYNGEGDPCQFKDELHRYSIPASFSEIGVKRGECDALIYERLINSTAMAGTTDDERSRLKEAIRYII